MRLSPINLQIIQCLCYAFDVLPYSEMFLLASNSFSKPGLSVVALMVTPPGVVDCVLSPSVVDFSLPLSKSCERSDHLRVSRAHLHRIDSA